MTEKRPTPNSATGKSRRPRAAPTIDLTATEVPASEVPAHESSAQDVSAQDVSAREEPPVTSEIDPPPAHVAAEPEPEPYDRPEPEPKPEQAGPPPSGDALKSSRFALTMPVLAAGIAGAAAMSLVLVALWLTGLVPIRYAGSTALRARVTGLEMQLQDLQKRPPPLPVAESKAPDTKAVDALAQRVGKMEEQLGAALTALNRRSDDIAASSAQARAQAETAVKAVTESINAAPSSADLAPLQQRIAALEQSAKAVNAEIIKVTNLATASDTAARLALAAAALRDAVAGGKPFTVELTQVKALGADDKVLEPLAAYASSGVPDEKTLAAELSALLPGMIKAAGSPPASGGFIERLQANAGQLVRIRPVDAPAGADPSALLARLEVDAAKADIAAALADLGKLSDEQRAPAQGWIAKAQRRQAALAAAGQYATNAARSLGSK